MIDRIHKCRHVQGHSKSLQNRRIIRIIDSACGFIDSRSSVHMSNTPLVGEPTDRSVITE